MKNLMRVAGFLTFALALLLAAPAVAQQSTYTIRVPFQFTMNSQLFPAGEYRVGLVGQGTLQIRGIDTTASSMTATRFIHRSSGQPLNAELTFHQYGTRYFLANVWFEDVQTGYQLFVSSSERDLAKQTQARDTVLRATK